MHPNSIMQQKPPFMNQAQASGVVPMRRPIPMPGNNMNTRPMRNMSASVFNLDQSSAQVQPGYQQPNPWGYNQMSQAQSMAQLNMMNQWNMQQTPWLAQQHMNGSNMSLNLSPQQYFNNDQQMFSPWPQQQYPYMMNPMMNGKILCYFIEKIY